MEKLSVSGITVEGVSEGGIRTSIGIPEVGVLFDAGDVIKSALRYRHICVSHGHIDHIGAIQNIAWYRHLQSMPQARVYVPTSIHSPLHQIFELWGQISNTKCSIALNPVTLNMSLNPKPNMCVKPLRNYHIGDSSSSLAWMAERTTHKLKLEYKGMEGTKIAALRQQGVKVTNPHTHVCVAYSGDTTIDFLINEPSAQQAKVLIHEVTIWTEEESSVENTRHYGHTHIKEMIEHCEKFSGESLVLIHRSMRHSRSEVENIVETQFPIGTREKVHIFDGKMD